MIYTMLRCAGFPSLSYSCLHFLSKHLYSSAAVSRNKETPFGNYNVVEPYPTNPTTLITQESGIILPSYALGKPEETPKTPEVKNESQIKLMAESCKLARFVLDCIAEHIEVGMTTDEINTFAHDVITNNGAYPSPLNYKSFPKSICTSVNNVVCHGIPDSRPLVDGDIISVDVSVYHSGYHGDCCATFAVGNVDERGQKLIKVTQQALNAAISVVKPGEMFSTIGNIIENIATQNKLSVVSQVMGHGIGSYFHGPPEIQHFRNNDNGKMEPGMTFTIEPAFTQGDGQVAILAEDNWTIVTVDSSRAAQFEHTILVTEDGYKVLTY